MFLFNQIGVGNMMKSIFLMAALMMGVVSAEASTSVPSKEHHAKMSKFRVQKDVLYTATRDSTVDMSEAAAIIGVESGWNVKIKNKTGSSATGLFQYIDSTWVSEKKMFAKELKLSHKAKRTDADANIKIGIKGLQRNKEILAAKLGITPDRVKLGDLYIMHLLGDVRAVKVIKGNPNALITKYVKLTKGNRSLYVTNKGKIRSVEQFRIAMNQKLELERKLYKQELQNLELSKLVEKISVVENMAINLPHGNRWYEPS